MRKHSPSKGLVLSMASINSLQSNSALYERTKSTNHFGSRVMKQFASLCQQIGKQPLVKLQPIRKQLLNNSEIVESSKPFLSRELKKAHEEIAEIKNEIKRQKSLTEGSGQTKLNRFIYLLRDSVGQKQSQPIYYPIPMPVPYLMQNRRSLPAIQSHHNYRRSNFENTQQIQQYSPSRDLKKLKQKKTLRIKKNMGKWKRAINVILFITYFKRFCVNVQKSRLFLYEKFAKSYSGSFKNIVKIVRQKMNHFFKVILSKHQVSFTIQEGQTKQIRKQKINLLRGLLTMILDGLSAAYAGNQLQISKFLYFLCRNGSFACTKPFLTFEQLELSCVSQHFRYISAQSNLTKVAIINTIFIKVLIFNTFMSPFQFSAHLNSKIVKDNLKLISSLMYELVIEVQDEYLVKVPKSYRIGNFQDFDFAKMAESMIVQNAERRQGQLISGLLSQIQLQRSFGYSEWGQQKKSIKILLQTISESCKKIHKKLTQRHY